MRSVKPYCKANNSTWSFHEEIRYSLSARFQELIGLGEELLMYQDVRDSSGLLVLGKSWSRKKKLRGPQY